MPLAVEKSTWSRTQIHFGRRLFPLSNTFTDFTKRLPKIHFFRRNSSYARSAYETRICYPVKP